MTIAIVIVLIVAHWFALEWLSRMSRETGYLRGKSDAADVAERAGQPRIALGILSLPYSNAHKSVEQRKKARDTQDVQDG